MTRYYTLQVTFHGSGVHHLFVSRNIVLQGLQGSSRDLFHFDCSAGGGQFSERGQFSLHVSSQVETYKLMISSYAQQDLIQVERVERAVEVKETETSQSSLSHESYSCDEHIVKTANKQTQHEKLEQT